MSAVDPNSDALEPLLDPGAVMAGHPPAYSPTDPSPRASAPPIDATFTGASVAGGVGVVFERENKDDDLPFAAGVSCVPAVPCVSHKTAVHGSR